MEYFLFIFFNPDLFADVGELSVCLFPVNERNAKFSGKRKDRGRGAKQVKTRN